MGQLSRSLSQLRRARQALALLPVPVLAALVALIALALTSGGVSSSPADGEDEYEPDAQVIAAVQGYAQETDKGYDHVLRWVRVLKTFGVLEGMTAAEAQEYAEQHLPLRWNPVVEELIKLESGQGEPNPQLVAAVRGYAQETKNGWDHVLRWVRVLISFGVVEKMTAAEAQGYADRGWQRWTPVAAELAELEGVPFESGELEVSIKASPTYPRPGDVVRLSAVIANPPAGSNPAYQWQLDLGGGQGIAMGRAATATYAAGNAGTTSFLLTVSYATGESASASLTVEWTETPPNHAPTVNRWAEWQFAGKVNAPRGFMITKTFTGMFSDPDGDALSYSASVPDDQRPLVESLGVHLRATASNGELVDFLFIIVDAEADWKAVSPALADPLTFPVTLTATDPGGLSASVTGDFFTDWASHPELVSAVAGRQAIELSFDQELQANPAPAPDQFTINVVNNDGSAGTVEVSRVSVNGTVLTLELASELAEGQTVTLDYAHDDEGPLTRAAGGGDSAPSFEGQAVELVLSLPPVDFAVSPVLGTMNLLATWQDVDSITSYKLRWRHAGSEFDAADAITVTSGVGVIPVSGYGRWEVRLQGCNDLGCGPETSKSVEVTRDLRLDLAPTRDAQGNAPPGTLTATWDPLPGATSYTLSWRRVGQPSQATGPRGGASGSSGPEERKITVSDERTGVDIPVPDDGEYRALLQANTDDDHVITQDTASVNSRAAQADTTPPRMVRGEIDGHRMTIYFSEPLDETAVGGRFYMAIQSGNCVCWSGGAADAPMVISGSKVMVDFSNSWPRARQGLGASAAYQLEPWDTTSLRDLAGNAVQTPDLWFGGTRTSWPLHLTNLTGRPFVIRIPAAGSFGRTGVVISSDAGVDRTYVDGETIKVKLTFSEAVDVTGTPRVRIDLDPADGGERWADYSGGTGTKMLEFDYTVASGDRSKEGVAVLQNTLELNGGAIRSASAVGIEDAKLRHGGLNHDRKHRVVTPSTAEPVLFDASVTGATLELTFSEPLAAAASLANNAFTVKKTPQDGDEETVSLTGTPSISGTMVSLTLASAVLDTDAGVRASYQKPDSGAANKLVDAAGDEAESFTDVQVRNTLDTTKPVLERVELDGDTLTLFFSEPLDETTGGAGDTYRINLQWNDNFDGGPTYGRCKRGFAWREVFAEPRNLYIDGNTVVVVGLRGGENSSVRGGVGQRTNNFRYIADLNTPADQRLRDFSGNHVDTPNHFLGKWYSDHVYAWGVTELPSPERITVDVDRLVMFFDAPMDGGWRPAASAFTVKVGGNVVNLASANPVRVGGREVTLILANAVAPGDDVTVSYTRPTSSWLRNVICEYAPSFENQSVQNVTGNIPAVTAVAIASDPGDDNTYGLGETIQVSITFSAAVDVDTAGGTPRLKIKLDPYHGDQWASYKTGTKTLTFTYTVTDLDTSSQGIAVLKDSLELNGGQIRATADHTIDARLLHSALGHDTAHKVDGVIPSLQDVTAAGSMVSLTFSEPLDEDSVPPASAFTVKGTAQGSGEETLSLSGMPTIAGATVSLTVANAALDAYTNVNVSYDKSDLAAGNRLRDTVGNEADSVAGRTDTTPPRLERAQIDGDVVTIFFSEAMDEVSGGTGDHYRVGIHRGSRRVTFTAQPREVKVTGNKVVVSLRHDRGTVVGAWANHFTYITPLDPTAERLRDRSGNPVSVPHEYSDWGQSTRYVRMDNVTGPPSVERSKVDRDRLTLTFDEILDTGSVPAQSAFTVTVNDSVASLANANPVALTDTTVTLTLASAVSAGDAVTVTYTKPAANPLRDLGGTEAESFSDQSVANLTGVPYVTGVAVTSSPASDDTYALGETIRVKLTFSESIDVTGAPQLKIKMDPTWGEFWADFESGSSSAELIFAYQVAEPNTSPRGIAVLANSLELNGGQIRSTADGTIDGILDHDGLDHNANHKVDWSE